MVIGLMNKLEDIGKIYRKTLSILAPSMEEYGTKLAPYSISCATKNVNLLPDPVIETDVLTTFVIIRYPCSAGGE